LADSDVYWDTVTSIEPDGETEVYDLTVPAHQNFVSENIVVHNSLEQDADIVMFLYRDEVYNEATEFPNQADIIVSKHRNGPTGTVSLYFEKTLTKFMNAAERSVDLSHI
jgi:replicative DNA helicase